MNVRKRTQERERPIRTIVKLKPAVRMASVGWCSNSGTAMSPPVELATMMVTMGSNHTAVIFESEWSWRTILFCR
jgi:hypothetical protein